MQINFVTNSGGKPTTAITNSILEAIKYSSNSQDLPGSINLTYTFDDGLNTDNSVVSSSITINVTQIDNAPVNTVPGTQIVNENANLVFNTTNSNLISISDVDADGGLGGAGGSETVTLTVAHGSLSLSNLTGLNVSGNNSSTIVATGTISNLNTALNGLIYKPNINYHGTDLLTVATNDNSNTGQGGPLTTTNTVNITVNQYNITPTINNLGATSVNTYLDNTSGILVNNNSNVTISDVQLNLLNSGFSDYSGSTLTVSLKILYLLAKWQI